VGEFGALGCGEGGEEAGGERVGAVVLLLDLDAARRSQLDQAQAGVVRGTVSRTRPCASRDFAIRLK
jgi:hypothetical protein